LSYVPVGSLEIVLSDYVWQLAVDATMPTKLVKIVVGDVKTVVMTMMTG